MSSIFDVLRKSRERGQTDLVKALQANSVATTKVVHNYIERNVTSQELPPPSSLHRDIKFPPIYDHTGNLIQMDC